MPKPNLNALRMFDAAARRLSFRAAAEDLNLTQGAVAQQVRKLEADLGHRLFDRLPRGLALTPAGRRYHASVAEALTMIDAATDALASAPAHITLSLPPSLASKWLLPRLAGLARDHPAIDLRTVASEGLTDFTRDAVDIAIRQGPAPVLAGIETRPLAPLDLCAVAAPALLTTLPCAPRLSDFADQPLIEDGHGHWSRLFARAGLATPPRMLRLNQTALAIDAAAQGQGIALAPRLLVRDPLAAGTLRDLWSPPQPDAAGFHLLWADRAKSRSARQAVVDWLLAQA